MSNKSIKIEGVSETLEVFEDKVTITPRGVMGFLTKGMKGTKEIPFRSINAMQFKKAGAVFSGYLQFTIAGGNESRSGLLAATQDENTFMFVQKENAAVENVKIFIEEKQKQTTEIKVTTSVSKADELIKLSELLKTGAISSEEFAVMKKEIIQKAG